MPLKKPISTWFKVMYNADPIFPPAVEDYRNYILGMEKSDTNEHTLGKCALTLFQRTDVLLL